MLEYAKNDVILLRDLTIYAMQLNRCTTFIELYEIANRYEKIHLLNNKKLKKIQDDTIISKIRYMTNNDLLKKGKEKDQLMKKLDKIISDDFKKFDRLQLYVSIELDIRYRITGIENEDESIYTGEFIINQVI